MLRAYQHLNKCWTKADAYTIVQGDRQCMELYEPQCRPLNDIVTNKWLHNKLWGGQYSTTDTH